MLMRTLRLINQLVFIPLLILVGIYYLVVLPPESRTAMGVAFALGCCMIGEMWKSKWDNEC